MANNKYIKYQDPLTSMGINHSRRGFLSAGRYYGFDGLDLGDFDNPKYTHSQGSLMISPDPVDEDNKIREAVIVSGQGLVITFGEAPIDIAGITVSPGEAGKFMVLYIQVVWSTTSTGPVVSYQQGGYLDDEPLIPDLSSVAPTWAPIGYIEFNSVGEPGNYKPYAKPYLAGQYLDTSKYAMYDKVNPFNMSNMWGVQALSEPDFSGDLGNSITNMNIGDEGNVVFVDLAGSSTPILIGDIVAPTMREGQFLFLYFFRVPARSAFRGDPGKLILNSLEGGEGLPITTGSPYIFVRGKLYKDNPNLFWVQWTADRNTNDWISQNRSRLSTNEDALVDHENRITQLEATGLWVDIPPEAVTPGWEVTSLQYFLETGGRVRFRAELKALAASGTGVLNIAVIPDEIFKIHYSTTVCRTSGGNALQGIGVIQLSRYDKKIKWAYPSAIASGDIYILEDTVVLTP